MGKKKHRKHEREAQDHAHAQGHDHAHTLEGFAPLAGIAAVVARQMGSPAGRQVIAAGLMAAAGAIAGRDARPSAAPVPPVPPVPPKPPEPPVPPPASPYAGQTPEPPRSDAPALPPEVTKVIGAVSAGLERWAAAFAKPPEPPKP